MIMEQGLLHLDHRLLGVTARSIGVLLGWKIGFEDRIEHPHRRRHAHPIAQARDAQRPELAVGLRDEHSSNRVWSVLLLLKRKRQFPQPPLNAICLDVGEVLAVYAR